jgi:hypothetical protein
MRISLAVFVIFALTAALAPAQKSKVVIRFVDGRNGHPIRDKSVNVWLGTGQLSLHDADARGEISLDAAGVEPRILRVNSNMRLDCRFPVGFAPGDRITYSLDDILSKGIVGENQCGKATEPSTPGVLVLFLRPRTLLERWML